MAPRVTRSSSRPRDAPSTPKSSTKKKSAAAAKPSSSKKKTASSSKKKKEEVQQTSAKKAASSKKKRASSPAASPARVESAASPAAAARTQQTFRMSSPVKNNAEANNESSCQLTTGECGCCPPSRFLPSLLFASFLLTCSTLLLFLTLTSDSLRDSTVQLLASLSCCADTTTQLIKWSVENKLVFVIGIPLHLLASFTIKSSVECCGCNRFEYGAAFNKVLATVFLGAAVWALKEGDRIDSTASIQAVSYFIFNQTAAELFLFFSRQSSVKSLINILELIATAYCSYYCYFQSNGEIFKGVCPFGLTLYYPILFIWLSSELQSVKVLFSCCTCVLLVVDTVLAVVPWVFTPILAVALFVQHPAVYGQVQQENIFQIATAVAYLSSQIFFTLFEGYNAQQKVKQA